MVRPVYLTAYYLSGYIGATVCFKLKVEGAPIEKGAVLVIGKHVSNWDIPVLSRAIRKYIGNFPHFEMGSFHGYPILGKVIGFLKWCGGFPVMRSKDIMRLRHTSGKTKEELRALMREVNDEAAEVRRQVLREGQCMCFFPEGTRDRHKVNRLRSVHEVEEALELIKEEGINVRIVPIVPIYGPKAKFFIPFLRRRPVTVRMLPPLDIADKTPREILADAQTLIEANWTSEYDD